ncbi:MAG: 30S ribosomal protein S17 [Deltaproteobacteria bacterium]|jgi:small subunit ribosomal protein S17|nr:MAG: 30S ribosomal protein S17 [Deltaproteobacteria bacterium]
MTQRGVRKRLVGVVVGNKMDKTAAVLVNRLKRHRTYEKYLRSQTKYMVHDPENRCMVGDRVRIIETRPISKKKRWQVLEVLERSAIQESGEEDTISLEQEK